MNEFNGEAPIYLQIINTVKRRIISGKLQPGEQLPSVRQLAEDMKVNPNTVIRSYAELERQGIAEKKRGTGTFITEKTEILHSVRTEVSQSLADDFICNMKDCGFSAAEIIAFIRKKLES